MLYWMQRALTTAVIVVLALATACVETRPTALRAEMPAHPLVADGESSLVLRLRALDGRGIFASALAARLLEGNSHGAVLLRDAGGGTVEAVYRAGILSGPLTIRVSGEHIIATDIPLLLEPASSDSFGDGTPDFLRLDSGADRQAFRRWFTLIADHEALLPSADVPAEISDCAALLRFAYRESLRRHDGRWMAGMHFAAAPALPEIGKYEYPHTPLGPSLFRVRPGPYSAADLQDGSFAEFADARTLLSANTHFVSRDLRKALPGDLLFYRQLDQRSPFHSMVYLGGGAVAAAGMNGWVVYHTGPSTRAFARMRDPGELRRVTVADLASHPDPRWHPLPRNPKFLGVYRWNILREAN